MTVSCQLAYCWEMARLLCDARGAYREDFLREIEAQSGGDVRVVLHAGNKTADIHAGSLTSMKRDRRYRKSKIDLMRDGEHSGGNLALLSSPDFHEMATMAIDHLHRMSSTYRYSAHNLRNLQDYLDYYYVLTDVIARKLIDEEITHVVFFMVPHLGYDTVMYQVARALGLKTIVMNQQSLFNDRFFSSSSIEDYGCFDPQAMQAAPLPLEKGQMPDLFFMESSWQQKGRTGTITPTAIIRFLSYVARHNPAKLADPAYLSSNLRRIRDIYGALPAWKDPFADFFHTNALAYFEHLAEYEAGEVDLSQNYVYVPLHNQPEMSASSLGWRYRDQMLIIEAVARNLPDGWRIYVKENPRQGAYARGPLFFHRLNRVTQARLVPSTTSSHALVANARAVATVAGTAGWEGLLSGVPAVTFGGAWYRSLHGVTPFYDGIDFQLIAEMSVDHGALESAFGALMERAHRGIIDQLFFDKVERLDKVANAKAVASEVLGLVREEIPTTFGAL